MREAGPDDLDVVGALRLAFLADHRGVAPSDLPDGFGARTRAYLDRQQRAGTIGSWLAEDDAGRAVGVVTLLVLDMPPRPGDDRTGEGYVLNMYVDPAARRQGIGRSLFAALLAGAEERDLRRLFLHATPDGRPLYEQAGFAPNEDWLELRARPGRRGILT